MVDTREFLVEVRDLISVPERWTKGANTRDANGDVVSILSPRACAYCLFGAIDAVAYNNRYHISLKNTYEPQDLIRDCIYLKHGHRLITRFNDDLDTTHADVLKILDSAIERASQ